MPKITDQGVLIPDEADVLAGVVTDKNAAFGNALTFYDSNGNFLVARPMSQVCTTESAIFTDFMGMLAYLANQFDPNVAEGRFQDAIGSIYFLTRNSAVATTVFCVCSGASGTFIPAGTKAQDTSGNIYASTADATIGASGSVVVTFACTVTGPITCGAGTLTQIYQIIPGWDTITNPTAGVVGQDVESRSAFEARRKKSVAINASSSLDAIRSAVLAVPNVIDASVMDNKTTADATENGIVIPARGATVVVAGGSANDIAQAIWEKVAAGTPLGGTLTGTATDTNYSPAKTYSIPYYAAATTTIYVKVTLAASSAIPNTATASIQAACVASFYGNGTLLRSLQVIGGTVFASAMCPDVEALGDWANIDNIKVSTDNSTWTDTVAISGAAIPELSSANISVTTA